MKLVTWNVNSLKVRLPQVLNYLQDHDVDILALQETKCTDDAFPYHAFAEIGYQSHVLGQKTYNGVALISKIAINGVDIIKNNPYFCEDKQARLLAVTFGDLRVISAYFPNGQAVGSEKFDYKMKWLTALDTWLQTELVKYPSLVLMGDFNITRDDADVWNPIALHESIHCSTQERQHLQALFDLGLIDAVRCFDQPAKNYSWWDYRDGAFRKKRGMRIDHVLVTSAVSHQMIACVIDPTPRKNERPSDHAPVVLSLKFKA